METRNQPRTSNPEPRTLNKGSAGPAAAPAAAADPSLAMVMEAPGVMDEIFDRLHLPPEMLEEQAPAGNPKAEAAKAEESPKPEAPKPEPETPPEIQPELTPAQAQWAEAIGAVATVEELEVERLAIAEETELSAEERAWAEGQIAARAKALGEPEPETEPETETEEETVEAKLTAASAELASARAKITELEEKLTKGQEIPIAIANIHPLFLEEDPGKIATADGQYAAFEQWALANWDGTEAQEDANGKEIARAYTKEQVRQRYGQIKEMREKIVPAALQAVEMRKAQVAQARKAYPELFDAKRPEYQILEQILRTAPGLKAVFPNIHVIIGDAIVGERLRLAKAKAKGVRASERQSVKSVPALKGKGTGKPAVARPGPGAGPRPSKRAGNEVSAERFVAMGANRGALVEMLRGAELPAGRE